MGFLKRADKLKKILHEILQVPAQRQKTTSRLDQSIRINDKVLQKKDGDITIIQSGEINTQIVNNVSRALQVIDELVLDYRASGSPELAAEMLMKKYMDAGYTWEQIKSKLKQVCYDLAITESNTQKQAAQKLGVARTTVTHYLTHNDDHKKGESNDRY